MKRMGIPLAAAALLLALPLGADVQTIERPNVSQPMTTYSDITFRKGDVVHVEAGGCARQGRQWTDYAPHAVILVPGAMEKPARVADVVGRELDVTRTPQPDALQLGYDAADYGDNGYGARAANDGPCSGPDAFVRVSVTHPLASGRHAPVAAASAVQPVHVAAGIALLAIAAAIVMIRRR
jgi:hypothetical protein